MRKYLVTAYILSVTIAMSSAQLKVDPANDFVKIGNLQNAPARAVHIQHNQGVIRLDRDANGPGFIMAQFTPGFVSAINSWFIGASIRNGKNVFEINNLKGAVGGVGTRAFLIDDSGNLIIGPNTLNSNNYRLYVEGSAFKNDGQSEWNIISDYRTKENIQPLEKGLKDILKLSPVKFEYNGVADTQKGKSSIGVIAQQIQEVLPEIIRDYQIDNETFLSINSSAIKWVLVNAIKEQQEIIEKQNRIIEEMQNQQKLNTEKIILLLKINEDSKTENK